MFLVLIGFTTYLDLWLIVGWFITVDTGVYRLYFEYFPFVDLLFHYNGIDDMPLDNIQYKLIGMVYTGLGIFSVLDYFIKEKARWLWIFLVCCLPYFLWVVIIVDCSTNHGIIVRSVYFAYLLMNILCMVFLFSLQRSEKKNLKKSSS